MFFIGDNCYYKPGRGIKKERCRIVGVTYSDKNFKYILEMKNDERVIENVSIINLSTW